MPRERFEESYGNPHSGVLEVHWGEKDNVQQPVAVDVTSRLTGQTTVVEFTDPAEIARLEKVLRRAKMSLAEYQPGDLVRVKRVMLSRDENPCEGEVLEVYWGISSFSYGVRLVDGSEGQTRGENLEPLPVGTPAEVPGR